jgi:hypothetical protein
MIEDAKELNDMLNRAAGYLSGEGWDKEAAAVRKAVSRIEKLEAALRVYANEDHWSGDTFEPIMFPEGECKCC